MQFVAQDGCKQFENHLDAYDPSYLCRPHYHRSVHICYLFHVGSNWKRDPMRTTCLAVTIYDKMLYMHPNWEFLIPETVMFRSHKVRITSHQFLTCILYIAHQIHEYSYLTLTAFLVDNGIPSRKFKAMRRLYIYILTQMEYRLNTPTVYDFLECFSFKRGVRVQIPYRTYQSIILNPMFCVNIKYMAQFCVEIYSNSVCDALISCTL